MTESLIPKRKRGRPRKNPLITNEVNYPPQPPKRRATMLRTKMSINGDRTIVRLVEQVSNKEFKQLHVAYNDFSHSVQHQNNMVATQWPYHNSTLYSNEFQRHSNLTNPYNNQPRLVTPRYNLRQLTKQVQRY